MSTKLMQNRVFVLGYDYNDARLHASRHPAIAEDVRDVTVVSAAAHLTTILGSVAGAHVAKVYVTPGAHRGEHYDQARMALKRCIDRARGEFIHLDSEGGSYGAL